jgi:hypothetical protein
LEYLQLQYTRVNDLSPLVNCTNIKYLYVTNYDD